MPKTTMRRTRFAPGVLRSFIPSIARSLSRPALRRVTMPAFGGAGKGTLEHDPEKWVPVFGKRSCSSKRIERDDDSKKRHPALLQPHHHAVGGAARVHHGEADEAGPVRLPEQGAAGHTGKRSAVDEHRERSNAAGNLERQRVGLGAGAR